MGNLFSYGTLGDPEVQRALFGREIEGAPDALPGFAAEPFVDADGGTYPRAVPSAGNSLSGVRFQVSEADLASADEYEGSGYLRIKAMLQSGVEAWAYVRKTQANI